MKIIEIQVHNKSTVIGEAFNGRDSNREFN
jgi:hypothetical protein